MLQSLCEYPYIHKKKKKKQHIETPNAIWFSQGL